MWRENDTEVQLKSTMAVLGGSEWGTCSIRLATSPMPSQITKMPGGTGTWRLTSIRMRSPLDSAGSTESPPTAIICKSSGFARNTWRISGSANSHMSLVCSNSSFHAPGPADARTSISGTAL